MGQKLADESHLVSGGAVKLRFTKNKNMSRGNMIKLFFFSLWSSQKLLRRYCGD